MDKGSRIISAWSKKGLLLTVFQSFPINTWWLIPLSKWVITPVISVFPPTYPIYNWGYNPLTKWDEPPSTFMALHSFTSINGITTPIIPTIRLHII